MVVNRLLVKLIVSALQDDFTASKKHEYTGYSFVSCCDLLKHLINIYANTDEFDLRKNQGRLYVPYNPNQQIEGLYWKITEAVVFADAGDAPFTARQTFNAAISSIAASEVFQDSLRYWRKEDVVDKTWAKFNIFFSKVHRGWKATLKITIGQHFPRVNSVTSIDPPSEGMPLVTYKKRQMLW